MTVPGTEWSRAISCVTETGCVLVAADAHGPLNGESDTLVPVGLAGGLGNPVNIKGMTEAVDIACEPGQSRCIVAGELGGLGSTDTGKYASVGPPGSNGQPKLYKVQNTQGLPAAVACIPGGSSCILAEDSGVQLVNVTGTAGVFTAYAGLDAQSAACRSATQCLVLTTSGIVPFDPGTRTFGTLRAWAPTSSNAAKIACYSGAHFCVAVADNPSVHGNSIVADVSPSTGAVRNRYPVSKFATEGLTCFAVSGCLAAGEISKGTYPDITSYPETLPIISGVPQGVSTVIGTGESDNLGGGIACAGLTAPLVPGCLAGGSEGTSGGPGTPTVGMLLPLTTAGETRSWVPGNPATFYQRYAVGQLTVHDANNGVTNGCTATAVPSTAGDLLITARHCMPGNLPDRYTFRFAPDHAGPVCPTLRCGTNPLGLWTTTSDSDITVSGKAFDTRRDWLFVKVHPASGQLPLQRVTGAVPIAFNPSYTQHWNVYGYPIGKAIKIGNESGFLHCTGQSQKETDTRPGNGPDWLGLTPDKTCLDTLNTTWNSSAGGMSGGPWFENNGMLGSVFKVEIRHGQGGPIIGFAGTYLDKKTEAGYKSAGGT